MAFELWLRLPAQENLEATFTQLDKDANDSLHQAEFLRLFELLNRQGEQPFKQGAAAAAVELEP